MKDMHVKKGDIVEVIVGDQEERGKRGKILIVNKEKNTVVVEGVNIVKRHTRPRKAQEKGGIVDKPRAIDASNVMVVCPKCSKATKTKHQLSEDGKRQLRACKKCGALIDVKAEKQQKKVARKKVTKQVKEETNKEE